MLEITLTKKAYDEIESIEEEREVKFEDVQNFLGKHNVEEKTKNKLLGLIKTFFVNIDNGVIKGRNIKKLVSWLLIENQLQII